MLAGKRRRLTPTFRLLFILLYVHRGDVVYWDQLDAELHGDREAGDGGGLDPRERASAAKRTCRIEVPATRPSAMS